MEGLKKLDPTTRYLKPITHLNLFDVNRLKLSPLYLTGYSIRSNKSARRRALLLTIDRIGLMKAPMIIKKLKRLANMNRGYNEEVYKILNRDMKWMKTNYF